MLRWIIPLLIASAIIFVLEYYAFQAVKTVTKNRVIRWVWLGVGLLVYLNLLYVIFATPSNSGQTKQFQMATGMVITILIPKVFILIILFGEDIVRLVQKIISWLGANPTQSISGRRKFISQMALGLAAIPFASFLYGIIQGRYNYKVLKYQLSFKDLPDALGSISVNLTFFLDASMYGCINDFNCGISKYLSIEE